MDSELRKEIINKWASGLPKEQQIVVLAEKVRDIPYGEVGSRNPEDVYKNNKGTCSGKHELLKELLNEIGVETEDYIAMHRFKGLKVDYPPELKEILDNYDIIDPHNFFKAFLNDKWVTIDVTWDKPLKKIGFPVNEDWDGKSDMEICVMPLEIIKTENPLEFKKERIAQLPADVQEKRKLFISKLSEWLQTQR